MIQPCRQAMFNQNAYLLFIILNFDLTPRSINVINYLQFKEKNLLNVFYSNLLSFVYIQVLVINEPLFTNFLKIMASKSLDIYIIQK